MNANELADVMEKYSVAGFQYPLCDEFKQAATMLRMLDGQLAFRIDAVTKYQKKVEEQQAEIEALKAHPVNPYQSITDTKIEPTVVSYTHPVELTDEEIIKTMVQFDVYSADDQCLIEAGRAILRKAQGVNSEQVPDFFFMENDLMGKR